LVSRSYGERGVTIRYRVRDLQWRPARRLVRFVAVINPTRGSCILMCTDASLSAVDIIRLYGLRFKIETSSPGTPPCLVEAAGREAMP